MLMDLITVTCESKGGVTASVRGHRLECDLSKEDGGGDRGASPSELLAASLGACIALMVGAYCRRQGYSDGEVRADLTTELGGEPRTVTGIVIDLQIPRDVPEERRAAVRRIAEACPIHRVLRDSVRIDLELV
jgi:putative redox protein